MSESMRPLWSVKRIAEYFVVEEATVLRWLAAGELKGRKINNRWRVTEEEVVRYRNAKYAEGAAS